MQKILQTLAIVMLLQVSLGGEAAIAGGIPGVCAGVNDKCDELNCCLTSGNCYQGTCQSSY